MNFSCPYCGGSRLEHLRTCPKVYSIAKEKQFNQKAKQEYFGESPNIFIGRHNYPNVYVGFLSNEDIPEDIDSPRRWVTSNYQIPKIVDLRSSLINSRFKANVKTFDAKFADVAKEIAMSERPVDVEVHLEKKPFFSINTDTEITPYGPSVALKKAEITENPSIPMAVEKTSEDELRAGEALSLLYKKGYDEHYLTKIISAGVLGIKKKMVPTRWAITAVDDTLGKNIISDIKEFKCYECVAHFGGYLGNYYLILFFPELWSYELFETYVGNPEKPRPEDIETASDYEGYLGRKDYASNTVGGYYAARLGILEYLKDKKRQASVMALRFITDEYYMALGVWVVRGAVREALKSKPIVFSDKELMLKYAKVFVKKRFCFDVSPLLDKSYLLKNLNQKRIWEY